MRLIDTQGVLIGVLPVAEALKHAVKAGLDLVEISPNASPPVCKILDAKKAKYEMQKRLKENKSKQKVQHLKEIKLKRAIAENDLNIKLKKTREFLQDGDKVKISMWFKGREIAYIHTAKDFFDNILAKLEDIAKIESPPKMEGKQIMMILGPQKIKTSGKDEKKEEE